MLSLDLIFVFLGYLLFFLNLKKIFFVSGETTCVNPEQTGTKCAAVYCVTVNPGCSKQVQMCLWPVKTNPKCCNFGSQFDSILKSKATQVKKYYTKVKKKKTLKIPKLIFFTL